MKKILFALLVLCTTFTVADAKVNFGVRAGYNLTNLSGGLSSDNKNGFYVGPTVKLSIPIVGLTFDASALYDSRNAQVNGTGVSAKQITIPVNVRYGIGLGSLANIFAFAGPQVGFNVGGNIVNDAQSWTWKKSNFSVNVGVGATILKHVEMRANYNIACGKTGEATVFNATQTALTASDAKYNAWQFGLCYYF